MNTNKPLIIIGIILLLAGIAAGIYEETQTTDIAGILAATTTDKPYENYSIPLIVGGIVLIIVAVFLKNQDNK